MTWEMSSETVPDVGRIPVTDKVPMELYTLTKDITDYAWYTTR